MAICKLKVVVACGGESKEPKARTWLEMTRADIRLPHRDAMAYVIRGVGKACYGWAGVYGVLRLN